MSDELTDAKTFPLQKDKSPSGPRRIPWAIAEIAYQEYSKRYGGSQSLKRLSERGGFSWGEMDMFYPDWREKVDLFTSLHTQLEKSERRIKDLEKIRENSGKMFHDGVVNMEAFENHGMLLLDYERNWEPIS